MARYENCGSYFRVRTRDADSTELTIAKCVTENEAKRCVAAAPKVKPNTPARCARREAARDSAQWKGCCARVLERTRRFAPGSAPGVSASRCPRGPHRSGSRS